MSSEDCFTLVKAGRSGFLSVTPTQTYCEVQNITAFTVGKSEYSIRV